MGYFDPEWNRLPTIRIHLLVAVFAIFLHLLLMIPVWIQMRKHEVQEQIQNSTPESYLQNRSQQSFAINCICMVICAIGSINLSYLNRYVI